jgi:hypothetical protein
MNTLIFVVEKTRRPQYLAVCQCGRRHGPYLKVALIPPSCAICDEKTDAKKIAKHTTRRNERVIND